MRLNKAIREEIVANIMKNWVADNPAPTSLKELRTILGDKIYKNMFGNVDFSAIPKNFIRLRDIICVQVKGSRELVTLPLSSERPDPHLTSYANSSPIEISVKYKADFTALEDAGITLDDYASNKKACEEQLHTICESVNTVKQLVELWPEVEEFFPAYVRNPSTGVNLPALRVDVLNKQFGIKPKQ